MTRNRLLTIAGRVRRGAIFAGIAAIAATTLAWGQQEQSAAVPSVILLAAIEGPIGPAVERHVQKSVEKAQERQAEALVLRINTPGGLVTSTRTIVSIITEAKVPVIGFVAPPGAHAASAGTYILYATHLAAMAPGTNVGAATPVQMDGGFPGGPSADKKRPSEGEEEGEKESEKDAEPAGDATMKKAVNDAVAFLRSLADMRGRNADWAEKAVREGDSLAARAAHKQGVIELLARDIEALLEAADGRTVTVAGVKRVLSTKGIPVEQFEPDPLTRLLGVLSNPNLALILLMIGVYGLIFEFMNPGAIGPGVVGVICLVLGLYALNQLPLDYAGLALVFLGIAFMVAEAFTPTFGVFGVGGVTAFVIGAAMLVDTDVPAYQISWWTIVSVAAVNAAFLIFLVGYLWKVYRRPGAVGSGRMVGVEGQVLDWFDGEGHVWASGERWMARGEANLEQGAQIRVCDVDGLTLIVTRQVEVVSDSASPAVNEKDA